jgi:hypothetical protein
MKLEEWKRIGITLKITKHMETDTIRISIIIERILQFDDLT